MRCMILYNFDKEKLSLHNKSNDSYGFNVCKDFLNYLGYKEAASTIIRKRNSKKCLYEYLITAKWKTEE